MDDFLKFRTFITPIVIQFLFWLGVIIVVLVGLIGFVSGIANGNIGAGLGSLLMVVLGPLAVRIYCELIIVAFRIVDLLGEIRNNTKASSTTG